MEYELVLVISPEVSDDDLPAALEKINRFFTDKGGTIKETKPWGRRKLSYPIKRFREASYVLELVDLEPEDTSEVEAGLRINEEVLRHLLVRQEE